MDRQQIRNILDTADVDTLKDALSILLSEGQSAATSAKNKIVDSTDFKNFAQAIGYLKRKYKFSELNQFSTEADLVYVDTGDRKVLLTKPTEGAKRETRFSNISYENEDAFFANAWEPVRKEKKADDRAKNEPAPDPLSALTDTSPLSNTSSIGGASSDSSSSSSQSQTSSQSAPSPSKADPFDTGSGSQHGGSGRFGNLEL